ncbi:MAG: putative MarR family transcription regulator [Halioglobus sp.]|jgi:predicted MarR family transcription regulator
MKTDVQSANADDFSVDRHWHLSTSDHEIAITEFEFSIFRIFAAFTRWMDDLTTSCQGSGDQSLSGIDFSILNVIRMHDRPKGISEVGRLLNRDDVSNIQYSIRKLTKAELIVKVGEKGQKKGVVYTTTETGVNATNRYAKYRREVLLPLTQSISADEAKILELSNILTLLSGVYDQAACVAATHR